jgi:hypothetical protein
MLRRHFTRQRWIGPAYPTGSRAMIDKPDMDRNGGDSGREMRLRAALRENLKRRKLQSRGRADQAAAANRSDSECRDE